ncbi:hypothetical protein ACQ4PT_026097 [Festuca glaucescens]
MCGLSLMSLGRWLLLSVIGYVLRRFEFAVLWMTSSKVCKRKLAEAPLQQEASKRCRQTVCATENTSQPSSSRLPIKERRIDTNVLEDTLTDEDSSALPLQGHLPTFQAPLAVMHPPVQDSNQQRAYKDAHMISGAQYAVKGVSVAQERNMADTRRSQAITNKKDSSTNFEVALSNSGTGKLSFTYTSENRSDFHMPDMESVCKVMEARCLRTYKVLEPNFSFMKLLQDTCQCIVDLGVEFSGPREKGMVQIIPAHNVNDITKGEEHVSIPIINESGNGILPPHFQYIPGNITFQDAHVHISLARIGDESCCSGCFGDCLAGPFPCACAAETGGEFAYTRDGLLREVFLDSCISMLQEPQKQKRFIKECWSKCGCARNCGNRVVQRGISRHLQVFLTPGNKGWGLRAAEELPRGTFVCEYAGEILTNNELYERNNQETANARHTYPVYLNSDRQTEDILEDDTALCLDATFYGNVARFINHRCNDANIIEVPVEIETPDHHYYHIAFFTKRKVKRFEELTWDYGMDFGDVNHPIKAFKCLCGSKHCRDKENISRSKSRALVLL